VRARAALLLLFVAGCHRAAPSPITVAERFSVAFASGNLTHGLAGLVTPSLARALPASQSKPAATSLRSASVDDVGPSTVGVAVSVIVDGVVCHLDVHVVRTPQGWRVDAFEL
jgi:hypothetical protein